MNNFIPNDYKEIWHKMTESEREFALKFERAQRGDLQALSEIAPNEIVEAKIKRELKEQKILNNRCSLDRVNAQRESDKKSGRRSDANRYKHYYGPEDWDKGVILGEGGYDSGDRNAVTLSPEDALIEAIDFAAANGGTLDDVMEGRISTPPRGRGRPKKDAV